MSIKSIIKKIVIGIYHIFLKLGIQDDLIFFESSVGRNYTGNPKYIYEKIIELGLDKEYKCVWSLEDTSIYIPGNCVKVKRLHFKYFYYLAVSNFWVSDTRLPSFVVKREGCTYIQTWHGTPLKKLALDQDVLSISDGMDIEDYKKVFLENVQTWDYLLSQSPYTSEKFYSAFKFRGIMLESGFPRNDILFKKHNLTELKSKLGIPIDKKVILYAPTWRDDQFSSNGVYDFVSELNFDLLRKELSDEYVILVKLHYLVEDDLDWSKYEGFIYGCDALWDIQELYLISDVLVTDYSSVMFDYAILGRPMIIHTHDYEKYKTQLRGFYFDIHQEFPGPITTTTQELIHEIQNYSPDKYHEQYLRFLKKYTIFDKGTASQQVINIIKH